MALGVGWLVLLGVALAAAVTARGYFEVEEVRTPELEGLRLPEASRLAERAGLTLRSYPVEAAELPADTITEQAPPPGTVVRAGRRISVGVNVPAEADRMPDLVGLSVNDAAATLERLALPAPDVVYVSGEGEPGRVVRQTPPAGSAAGAREEVELEVGRGADPSPVELPDLVGMNLDQARRALAALGVRRVEAVASGVSALSAGSVTQQRPQAGTVIERGRPVLLGYALEGRQVAEVPDVAGMEPWRARVALRSAGLELGPVEVVHRDDTPVGVVAARPSGLTPVGTPVFLVVNTAPGTEVDLGDEPDIGPRDASAGSDEDDGDVASGGGRRVPFRFDPTELGIRSLMNSDYHLRLVVSDAEGERTVLDETLRAGESIRSSVTVHGDEPLLQTYVNGVFFQAWRP